MDQREEPRIVAQRTTDLVPMHVGHLGIENDEVRLRGTGAFERLLPGIGSHDGVAVGTEDALERARRPFLVVGDEHERRA